MNRSTFLLLPCLVLIAVSAIPTVHGDEPAKPAQNQFPTAEELSRQILPLHPKPRDEAERKIMNQLLPKVRVGGLIIAHDSSGQADQLPDYFQAIIDNDDLKTVLIDASKWGMCITRKMR